ncbi:MAG TPA: hypothetical protein VFQ45_00210 [Longimicrobium sp.]|nr:hypothetical protein [Longimicrobium sp.]
MNDLTEFLFPAPARRAAPAIVAWWERRRLAYNAWVGAAGLVSLATVGSFSALVGGEAMFPGALVLAAVFGGMANLCYCLGPAAELLFEKLWGRRVLPTGPMLFRMGLTFSVGLALFPALLTVLLAAARVVLAVLGLHWD